MKPSSGFLAAVFGLIALGAQECFPQLQAVTFSGPQSTDGWNINYFSYPQSTYGGFPGTKSWPQPMVANAPGSQGGTLTKVTNGLGGGPYPGDHYLYFGGFGTSTNIFGGTIKLSVLPLASVKKIALQVQICEAFGLDFYSPGGTPSLFVNSVSPTANPTVTRTQHELIEPGGLSEAPEYLNTYRYEWDVAAVQEVIGSIEILMSVVQHGQIYALQVDQGAAAPNTPVAPSLKILNVGPVSYLNGDSSVQVTFLGEAGKNYILEYNEGLSSSEWVSGGQSIGTGSGTFSCTFHATGDRRVAWQRQLFFRACWP